MAKVRVYELARELNLDSKELVEKLQNAGIKVKNYMSTLDEGSVAKARDLTSGKVSEVIEEQRIKPTVIRRRRKRVKVSDEAKVRKEVEIPTEESPEEPIDITPEETTQEKEAPIEVSDELPGEEPKQDLVTDAAKIVMRPDDKTDQDDIKEEVTSEDIEDKEQKKIKKKKTVKGKIKEEEKLEPTPEKRGKEKPTKAKKGKKGKKKKSDQPAKIIMKAEEGPLKDIILQQLKKEEEEEVAITPEQKIDEIQMPPSDDKKEKPSRKKKDKKKGEKKELSSKNIVRHRKLAVFERADLYEGRKVKRKDKKSGKKQKDTQRKMKQTEITVPKAIKRKIKVPEKVTVAELAKAMGIKAVELLKKLLTLDVRVNINQLIDFDTAVLAADEFGYELELDVFEMDSLLEIPEEKPEDLVPRPPVVTIMGHVDHGKTSLLDYIRESNIIGGESGGITQHIGAYYVKKKEGDIVFLDTPGHEAFTAMRARGAKVTDIVILVVAADDGVMPQTKEAVNHARAAEIPIIVAINKIDKPEADLDRVKRELAEVELVPEDWGGDTIFGNISAKTGQGIDELLELILLQAEMLELKANPNKSARGIVIEAKLDKSKGPLATVLINGGTLKKGDYFICGGHFGKVRALLNDQGRMIVSAGPSVPVELTGISGVPMAGDEFIIVDDEKKAKQIIAHRQAQMKIKDSTRQGVVSLDDLYERIKEGKVKELNIILKADVQGSLEAVTDSLVKLSTQEVKLKVIHSSTGAITETDVMFASTSNAVIIGFNVRANPRVVEVAEKEKIDIRYYDVIYDAIQDIKLAMAGLLDPVLKEKVIGRADTKEVFKIPKIGAIAGCYITDGHVERSANVRLLRDEVVIYKGKLSSLRRFKEDVKEVQTGYECGIGLENFQDVKPGDVFEIFQIEEIKAEL